MDAPGDPTDLGEFVKATGKALREEATKATRAALFNTKATEELFANDAARAAEKAPSALKIAAVPPLAQAPVTWKPRGNGERVLLARREKLLFKMQDQALNEDPARRRGSLRAPQASRASQASRWAPSAAQPASLA